MANNKVKSKENKTARHNQITFSMIMPNVTANKNKKIILFYFKY